LHLAENLRLADHHRVEPGSHAERVPDRFALRQRVEVGLELLWLDPVIPGEPIECGLRLTERAVDLGPIARRQDSGFFDRLVPGELRQGRAQALSVERYALADRERRGLVIQSQREELHGG